MYLTNSEINVTLLGLLMLVVPFIIFAFLAQVARTKNRTILFSNISALSLLIFNVGVIWLAVITGDISKHANGFTMLQVVFTGGYVVALVPILWRL